MKTFAVSKVGLDPGGRITAVLWGQVDTGKNAWATPEVVVPVAAAVDAALPCSRTGLAMASSPCRW